MQNYVLQGEIYTTLFEMNKQDLSKETNVHQRPKQYLCITEKLKAGKCKVKNKGLASGD